MPKSIILFLIALTFAFPTVDANSAEALPSPSVESLKTTEPQPASALQGRRDRNPRRADRARPGRPERKLSPIQQRREERRKAWRERREARMKRGGKAAYSRRDRGQARLRARAPVSSQRDAFLKQRKPRQKISSP